MFKSITAQSITAIAAAAAVAGLAVFLTSVAPEAKAEPRVKVAVHQHHAKGNRLVVVARGTACSLRGWPNYEQSCQFDLRRPANEARTVRIIALR